MSIWQIGNVEQIGTQFDRSWSFGPNSWACWGACLPSLQPSPKTPAWELATDTSSWSNASHKPQCHRLWSELKQSTWHPKKARQRMTKLNMRNCFWSCTWKFEFQWVLRVGYSWALDLISQKPHVFTITEYLEHCNWEQLGNRVCIHIAHIATSRHSWGIVVLCISAGPSIGYAAYTAWDMLQVNRVGVSFKRICTMRNAFSTVRFLLHVGRLNACLIAAAVINQEGIELREYHITISLWCSGKGKRNAETLCWNNAGIFLC